jgi:ribosome-binding ATPase
MKIGIIGLSKSGKTTVFNALTGSTIQTGTYGAQKANLAVIKVPDARIDFLAETYRPKKTTYAEISFVDIPGPSDSNDSALGGTQTIDLIKGVDTLAVVVRAFENELLPTDRITPQDDYNNVEAELVVLDLIVLDKKLERMKKEQKKDAEFELIKKCKEWLEEEKPLRLLDLEDSDAKVLNGFQLLSLKPVLVLINKSENDVTDYADFIKYLSDKGTPVIELCGTLEMEIASMEPSDQEEFLKELGISVSARSNFIRAAYELSDLVSFFTAGEDEVKAWTIRKGDLAPKAAGKIHSDIERGFIRAEVISFEDFKNVGSTAKAKDVGKYRLEGKQYGVLDGDIINFRFNV